MQGMGKQYKSKSKTLASGLRHNPCFYKFSSQPTNFVKTEQKKLIKGSFSSTMHRSLIGSSPPCIKDILEFALLFIALCYI